VNIITLEDPVEYFMEGVNQVQVKPEIGLTFASGLRSILRQDPNIIMVGEIRDKETAELAVHAALTGHLVFATLHTNDAVGAIPRLVDMGIEPFLLTASVNGVVAQRLVRKICQKCKREVPPPQHVVDMIQSELQSVDPAHAEDVDLRQIKLFSGAGCPACGKSGYQGRCGIFEVLPIAQEIQDLILQKPSGARIQEVAQETLKMISMKQDGLLKVLRGITTIEEVLRVTSE
jgi:type IV pilus assembly protein PilB